MERYTLSAPSADLQTKSVRLNGKVLELGTGDSLPTLEGEHVVAGRLVVAPETITFLAIPGANNQSCR